MGIKLNFPPVPRIFHRINSFQSGRAANKLSSLIEAERFIVKKKYKMHSSKGSHKFLFLIIIKRISFNLMIPDSRRNEDINTTMNNQKLREREIVIIQSIISIHVPVFKFHMAPPRPRKRCTRKRPPFARLVVLLRP